MSDHDCTTCLDCIHDGNKCCGCYDGACCQKQETTSDLIDFLNARIADDQTTAVSVAHYKTFAPFPYFRVLADCEAKRRIVTVMQDNPTDWGVRVAAFYLAQVYADHPDYREEWRP